MTMRFEPRPPFGIRGRSVAITFAVSVAATAVGFVAHVPLLAIVAMCVAMTTMIMGLAYVSNRAGSYSFELRDDALVVSGRPPTTVPYAQITHVSITGNPQVVYVKTADQDLTFGTGSIESEKLAQLVAELDRRRAA